MVTQETLRELFSYDPETGLFTRIIGRKGVAAGAIAGTVALNGYITIGIDKKRYYAHRLAWLWVHGEMPEFLIDHENGNKTDNRIANLRRADKAKNAANSKIQANNKSGHKNVCWHKGMKKWHVQLRFDGKQHNLGFYSCLDEAAEVARKARIERHKEFARHS